MSPSDAEFIRALEDDTTAMADIARGRLDAPVPACPGWDVKELLVHTGGVHRFWNAIADGPLADPSSIEPNSTTPPDGGDDAIIGWFQEGGHSLAGTLAETPSDTRCWTWASVRNVGFIKRRMAQETAVHRVDAEQATGTERAIGRVLAADGIDEFVTHMMKAYQGDTPMIGDGETVALRQSDGDGGWGFTLTPEGLQTGEAQPAEAEATGTASDLLLVLWRRLPADRLEVTGDRALIDRLVGAPELD